MNNVLLTVPAGMIFKKYYCKKCGKKLSRKKIVKIYNPDDEGYEQIYNELSGTYIKRRYILKNPIKYITYSFICPDCSEEYSFEEQKEISKLQKSTKSKIL